MKPWIAFSPTAALSFGAAGVALILASVALTFLARKPNLSVSELLRAGHDVAAHPERYVRADRVGLVRWMSMAGALAWLAGVAMVASEALARAL